MPLPLYVLVLLGLSVSTFMFAVLVSMLVPILIRKITDFLAFLVIYSLICRYILKLLREKE